MYDEYMFWKKKREIYMDNAAATPVDSGVLRSMHQVQAEIFANPGGLHKKGIEAKKYVEDSRKVIADLLHVRPGEIVFTRGGTEANTLPILGCVRSLQEKFPDEKIHIVSSSIEHPAVAELLGSLVDQGIVELSLVSIDHRGIVDLEVFKSLLQKNTRLVSIMYVNNEIGTIQPIREIAKIVRRHRKNNETIYPLVHTDAIQAAGVIDIHIPRLGVDMLSLSGSKIYGPRGLGCVYVQKSADINPIFFGGDQEYGLRSGTEDVAGCVGLAKALTLSLARRESEYERVLVLQKEFLHGLHMLQEQFPESIRLHGSFEEGERVPGIVHIGIDGMSGERLVIELDARHIAASSRAACGSSEEGQSVVVMALYVAMERVEEITEYGMVRFSMGRETSSSDVAQVLVALHEILEKIRNEEKLYADK
jgi:cysteine desulfurase